MAVQDQRQDALLNPRPARHRLVWWLGVLSLGGIFLAGSSVWLIGSASFVPRSTLSGVEEVGSYSHEVQQKVSASFQPQTESVARSLPELQNSFLKHQDGSQAIRATSFLSEQELRRRIADVEAGVLGESAEPLPPNITAGDIRGGAPLIEVLSERLVIRPESPVAGVEIDSRLVPSGRLGLDLYAGEVCLVEAPLSGPGLIIDGSFLAPGQSQIVGTGSVVQVQDHTILHIRPLAGPLHPSGAG